MTAIDEMVEEPLPFPDPVEAEDGGENYEDEQEESEEADIEGDDEE